VYDTQMPRLSTIEGLQVREDIVFTDAKGRDSTGARKRSDKQLTFLREPLQRLLGPEEAILCVFRCNSPISDLERFTGGWLVQKLTTATLVLTNQRLLHFPTDAKGRWKRSTGAIAWSSIAEAKVKGFLQRSITLRYGNRKIEKFWNVEWKGAGKVKRLLPLLAGGLAAAEGERVHVCPDCYKPLTNGQYSCSSCGLLFKDEQTLWKRTLFIPGGGFFYCNQILGGILHALGESYLLLDIAILTFAFILALLGKTKELDPVAALTAFAFVSVFFVIEKAIVLQHCRRMIREFIPLKRTGLDQSQFATGTPR